MDFESIMNMPVIEQTIASTVRRKYAYHFSRLQMMIVSRFIMVGLFPPCCTSAIEDGKQWGLCFANNFYWVGNKVE
jgi:hypothetical protein